VQCPVFRSLSKFMKKNKSKRALMLSGSRVEMIEVYSNHGGEDTILIRTVFILEVKHYFLC